MPFVCDSPIKQEHWGSWADVGWLTSFIHHRREFYYLGLVTLCDLFHGWDTCMSFHCHPPYVLHLNRCYVWLLWCCGSISRTSIFCNLMTFLIRVHLLWHQLELKQFRHVFCFCSSPPLQLRISFWSCGSSPAVLIGGGSVDILVLSWAVVADVLLENDKHVMLLPSAGFLSYHCFTISCGTSHVNNVKTFTDTKIAASEVWFVS